MKISSKSVLHIVVFFALMVNSLATYTPVHAASTLYVKETPTGNGDCSSWDNACALQTALTNSASGDQIWVMAGTYKPTGPNGDRAVSFVLKSGVAVYGGYTGTGTQRNIDPATNGTVLSGDLNGNDNNFTNNSENSYHVVTATNANSSTILDGFTIRGGNANGSSPNENGGGMFNNGGSPALGNIIFSSNSAAYTGGGITNIGSNPTLTNVKFSGNSAFLGGGIFNNNGSSPTLTTVSFLGNSSSYGGGIYNINSSSPTLTNVTFSGNSAPSGGGGMNNYYYSSPTLTNVTFSNNTAGNPGGGGMLNATNSNAVLNNVTFSNNSAPKGGGMYNVDSNPKLTNITFSSNSATGGLGGGMYNTNSTATLSYVTFSKNSASYGGGIRNDSSHITLSNVMFSENSADEGGGLFNNSSNPTLTDVTFSKNTAVSAGGGLRNWVSSPILKNVTFAFNSAPYGGGMQNTYSNSPRLTNVTFSGNSATAQGGGILIHYGSNAILTNVTFSGNSAPIGGGMYISVNSSPTLINTLITDSPTGGDCAIEAGLVLNAASSNNLIKNASSACGLTTGVNGNIVGYDPLLNPLADNAGFTQTHALQGGSPAIDMGKDSSCLTTDQRGVARAGNHCDIGAYESPFTATRTISGNAGAAGVTLSYVEGTPKTVLSQANGSYAITVGAGWTGTVTPSLNPCIGFNPPIRVYPFLPTDQTAQNYGIGYADCINVKIGATTAGMYTFPTLGSSLRQSYALNNGAVIISNPGGDPFIASERVAYYDNNLKKWTGFSELMGFPLTSASSRYTFPFYNNVEINTQLRIGNVGNTATNVNVKIGNQFNQTYALGPNQSTRVNPKIKGGPIVVTSSGNVPIIASTRIAYLNPQNKWTSFTEMMGMPDSNLSKSYLFPVYNNVDLNSQLRIANVDNTPTTVTVIIGGVAQPPITLDPGTFIRKAYIANNGPVQVVSSAAKIVASLSVAYTSDGGTTWPNVSELMGFPVASVGTMYYFPWYNNKELNTQLRFANVGNTSTTVAVKIGGVVLNTYSLAPHESQRVAYPGLSSGPVVIQSLGNVPIIASQRVGYYSASLGAWTSFSEMMGLPANQMANAYVFPWYNNIDLDTQIRFGVP